VDLAIFGLHLSGVSSLLGAMNLNLIYEILVFIKEKSLKNSLNSRLKFNKCYSISNKPEYNFNYSGDKNPKKNKKPKLDNK